MTWLLLVNPYSVPCANSIPMTSNPIGPSGVPAPVEVFTEYNVPASPLAWLGVA